MSQTENEAMCLFRGVTFSFFNSNRFENKGSDNH